MLTHGRIKYCNMPMLYDYGLDTILCVRDLPLGIINKKISCLQVTISMY